MSFFIDSHCHLNYPNLREQQKDIIQRAKNYDIKQFINICTKQEEMSDIIITTDEYPEVFATVGIHPHDSEDLLEKCSSNELYEWLYKYSKHPKVVALGETGLDFYYNHSKKLAQIASFQTHIEVAKKTKLPLVIHTRSASQETIDILAKEQGKITGVIHCFSENHDFAIKVLDLGFYISISGIITFKKADELREVVKKLPLERLLLETDSPFLAPVPFRSKVNEPAYMIETAKVLAGLKQLSQQEIAHITTTNVQNLFHKIAII